MPLTFKPAVWYPIALGLTAVNLIGIGFAAAPGEAGHAAIHAGLAGGFALWAGRLRRRRDHPEAQPSLEALQDEVSLLREELMEAQERLDFTERLLAQRPEPHRVDQQRR